MLTPLEFIEVGIELALFGEGGCMFYEPPFTTYFAAMEGTIC